MRCSSYIKASDAGKNIGFLHYINNIIGPAIGIGGTIYI